MAELSPTESQLIGSRIREARVKRRMSQAELADKAGISLPQISTIENGRCSMKLHSFIRIIEALQVSAEFDPSSGHTGNKRNLSKPV